MAACAGIIVFGSLMGAMFIGQQFLQNVLAYSTFEAGAAIIPAASRWSSSLRGSARLVEANGARATPFGYVFVAAGFVTMFPLWDDGIRTCRWRWAMSWSASAPATGHAGIALTDRVGAGTARRDGVGHGRPPA